MGSWPVTGEVESRVLRAVGSARTATTPQLTQTLGLSTSTVHATLVRLVQAGLVHAEDGEVTLTVSGRMRVRELKHFPDGPPPNVVDVDLGELGRAVRALWSSATATPPGSDANAPADGGRGALLAADTDRDTAVHVLADALAAGRLTAVEFDERTNRALAARTYEELDGALQGLGGLPRVRTRTHPARKVLFWVVAVLSSPFVLMGSMLTAFGSDTDDLVVGLVLLALTLPGLFGLWRWAWPRS